VPSVISSGLASSAATMPAGGPTTKIAADALAALRRRSTLV
jgi:hypothetical protein